jgi:LmbE family N-acetylglucosaminyl deacetylase
LKLSNTLKYSCFAVLLLLLAGGVSYCLAIRSLYNYDVTSDYRYVFQQDEHSTGVFSVKVQKDHFMLPQGRGSWDTGLLKLKVHSNVLGKIFLPFVEVSYDGKRYKQYFEYGAEGIRYISIRKASNTDVTKVVITGHNLSWDDQDNQLYLFRNPKIADKKILVIAPHPDDAEIAAFGLYSYKNSYIVTVTDGTSGSAKYEEYFAGADKASSYGIIAKLRVIDSLTVPTIGGVGQTRCYNLAYYSETLKEMNSNKTKEVTNKYTHFAEKMALRKLNLLQLPQNVHPDWESLVDDLSYILRTVQPDIIVSPHPSLDSNLDHQFSAIALLEALKKTKLENDGRLYLYSNHFYSGKSFQFGKQGSESSVPPLFSKLKFKSVYSYELPQQLQVEKLFALDSMHDLRPLPYKIDISLFEYFMNTAHTLVDFMRNGSEFDLSYYRKAIKSNELFFVYPFGDASEILSEYKTHQ